jgi:hypothetical protein
VVGLRHHCACSDLDLGLCDPVWSPGDEIYRSPPPPPSQPQYVGGAVTNPPISVFEVDGKKAKVRAGLQSLCSTTLARAGW